MYQPKIEPEYRCPLEHTIHLLNGKWKPRILCRLSVESPMRYTELRQKLQDITDAALSTSLQSLMESGLVRRISYDEIPPRVEYSLTEKGRSIMPVLYEICRWSSQYFPKRQEELSSICLKCGYPGHTNPSNKEG